MICFDCITQRHDQKAAVGVCARCGAGMCADCVRTEDRSVTEFATVGNPVDAHTRALYCASCDLVASAIGAAVVAR